MFQVSGAVAYGLMWRRRRNTLLTSKKGSSWSCRLWFKVEKKGNICSYVLLFKVEKNGSTRSCGL